MVARLDDRTIGVGELRQPVAASTDPIITPSQRFERLQQMFGYVGTLGCKRSPESGEHQIV